MQEQFERTARLLGENAMEALFEAHVAVFGIGGVGGYAVEALARSGVGEFTLVDKDKVSVSNINRQIIADHDTVGHYKVDVMKQRILKINPGAKVNARKCFYLPKEAAEFDFSSYSYVVDAVDTVTAKLDIIARAKNEKVPVISAMGAGNKLVPSMFEVADIYETSVCPLAKVMRRELKKRGITDCKVVYSKETPIKPCISEEEVKEATVSDSKEDIWSKQPSYSADKAQTGSVPASIAFVPSVAGLIMAGEVVKDLCSM